MRQYTSTEVNSDLQVIIKDIEVVAELDNGSAGEDHQDGANKKEWDSTVKEETDRTCDCVFCAAIIDHE